MQTNSYDCGVFVCRYAYSVMLLRQQSFPVTDSENVYSTISNSAAFNFTSRDITKLRKNMKDLIQNLAKYYKQSNPTGNQSLSSSFSTDSNEKERKESTAPKYPCTAGLRNLGISM